MHSLRSKLVWLRKSNGLLHLKYKHANYEVQIQLTIVLKTTVNHNYHDNHGTLNKEANKNVENARITDSRT